MKTVLIITTVLGPVLMNSICFMSVVADTSGRLHCESVNGLFLQTLRKPPVFLQIQESLMLFVVLPLKKLSVVPL